MMSEKIIHLISCTGCDTLCLHDFELINEKGEIMEMYGEDVLESCKELLAKEKYNTNCRYCQEAVESVLKQIS